MSQANDLLNNVSESASGTPTEGNLVIGRDRYIFVPDNLKKIGVQYDHDIETVTFDCPRYWDEWDFAKMKIYVNYMRSDGAMGTCLCTNAVVDSADSELIHFDWTISGNVTQVAGDISFLVCIRSVDSDGKEKTHWNSELNTEMYVSEGLKCQETVLRRYPDIITQLLTRMEVVEAKTTREAMLGYVETYLTENSPTWMEMFFESEEMTTIINEYLAENGVKTFVDIEIGKEEPDHPCLWFNTDEVDIPGSAAFEGFQVVTGPTKPDFKCLWVKTSEAGGVGTLVYVDAGGNELEIYPDVKTDPTLTVSGKSADAAAVGVALKNAGAKAITLTQEEYDALSEEEKNNGIYVIPDGEDLTAKNLFYDGGVTGLGNTVQNAIDNLNRKVNYSSGDKPTIFSENGVIPYESSYSDSGWYRKGITYSIPVIFNTPFYAIPTVSLSYSRQNSSTNISCSAVDITRSGFTIKFTVSTDDKFEINWHAEVDGVAISEIGTLEVESGTYGAAKYFVISFEKTFNTVPSVIVSSDDHYLSVAVTEVTKGGFKVSVINTASSDSSRDGTITWNATADII